MAAGWPFCSNKAVRRRAPACKQAIAGKFPKARWHVYEPIDLDLAAPGRFAGLRSAPSSRIYKLDQAQGHSFARLRFHRQRRKCLDNIRRFAKGRLWSGKDRLDEPALRGREPVHLDRRQRRPSSARAAEP